MHLPSTNAALWQVKVSNQFFELITIFSGILSYFRIVFYILLKKVKHFETKFALTDFKVNLLNLKRKKNFKEKNILFKKLIRNFKLPCFIIYFQGALLLHK